MEIYTQDVTAIQWTGYNHKAVTEAMGASNFDPHGPDTNDDDPDALASIRDDHHGGTWKPVTTGDWICRDDAGDWHIVGNERFTACYRETGEAGQA